MTESFDSSLERPIFLIASERSGTNLLRAMMGAHPDVAAPTPVHLLTHFVPVLADYGDLEEDQNWQLLCRHVAESLDNQNQIGAWSSHISFDDLLACHRSFGGLFDHAYAAEAAALGRTRVFFKENETYRYAWRLLALYPTARFVYLVRDGRDCLSSRRRAAAFLETLQEAAESWSSEQRASLAIHAELKPSGRIIGIRFEDLIADPERMLRGLCDFVGLEFHPAMLDYHKKKSNRDVAATIGAWRNLSRPVMKDNSGNWRRSLSARQLVHFESIAAAELESLGYGVATPRQVLTAIRQSRSKAKTGFHFVANATRGVVMKAAEFEVRRRRFAMHNRHATQRAANRASRVRPEELW